MSEELRRVLEPKVREMISNYAELLIDLSKNPRKYDPPLDNLQPHDYFPFGEKTEVALDDLEKVGLVELKDDGLNFNYWLTPEGKEIVYRLLTPQDELKVSDGIKSLFG